MLEKKKKKLSKRLFMHQTAELLVEDRPRRPITC